MKFFRVLAIALGMAGLALTAWLFLERRSAQAVPILAYHRIADVPDSPWCVPPDVFEQDLRSLREQGYESIQPADLAAHETYGRPIPKRSVIITFDDGYLDCMTAAEPLLNKYGFIGIAYLVTELVADSPAARRKFEGADCLTWPEVEAMLQRGTMAFGGHSHSHLNLVRAEDPAALARKCRQRLAEHGIKKSVSFCYPYGRFNARAMQAVQKSGFTTAMICEDAVARTGTKMNLLALPRVSVMGGRHRFDVKRLPEKNGTNTAAFSIVHDGINLEVCLKLIWRGGYDCLAPRELGKGEMVLTWPLPDQMRTRRPVVEIWDRNGILLLHRYETE